MELWNKRPIGYMAAAVSMLGCLEADSSSQTLYRNIFLQIKDMMRDGTMHALFIYRRDTPQIELAFNSAFPLETAKSLEEDLNALKDGLDKPLHLLKKDKHVLACPIFTSQNHYLVGVIAICGELSYLKRTRRGMKHRPFKQFLSIVASVLYQAEIKVGKEYDYFKNSLTDLHDECMLRRDLERVSENGLIGEYIFALIGVDHFKTVNDFWGYSRGNDVLCEVSRVFKDTLKARENAYRMEGDKFVLMLRADYRKAYERLEKLLAEANALEFLGKDTKESSRFHISVSASMVDLSRFSAKTDNYIDELYRAAFDYLKNDGSISIYGQRNDVTKPNTPADPEKEKEKSPEKKPEDLPVIVQEKPAEAAVKADNSAIDITKEGRPDEGINFTSDIFPEDGKAV